MKLLKTSFFTIIALTSLNSAHASPGENKTTPQGSVEYFLANPKAALETVKACDKKMTALSDHKKIYGSEGSCRNAMLARKQIVKQRNSSSNKKPTFEIIDWKNANDSSKQK